MRSRQNTPTTPWIWNLLLVGMLVLVAGCSGSPTPAAGPQPATPAPGASVSANITEEAPAATVAAGVELPATVRPAPTLADPTSIPPATALPTASPQPPATADLATATPTAADLSEPTPVLPSASLTPTSTTFSREPYPLQVDVMRTQAYPGSEITLEQTLTPGSNYGRSVVSYKSDGYTIYALMTVPNGEKPPTGWPVIVFNHGYIPPAQYRTTERYVAYVDAIASSGYIVFKSDYRGHGSSEGPTTGGGYGSPGYTNDVLNALASLKAYKDADPNRIGMWGHSMGGQLTLRAMVVSKDIKAGVIWGGVVAPYPDIFARGNNPARTGMGSGAPSGASGSYSQRGWRQELTAKYGTPDQNPKFWSSISPNAYLADLSGPLQLHHSTTDEEVPVASSQVLFDEGKAAGLPIDLYTYPGDNHNINGNFDTAMQRSIAFFDQYVKGS